MSGLDTLADEGLDLQLLESSSKAELIEWHPASGSNRGTVVPVLQHDA